MDRLPDYTAINVRHKKGMNKREQNFLDMAVQITSISNCKYTISYSD
jgi:hypothetical protein